MGRLAAQVLRRGDGVVRWVLIAALVTMYAGSLAGSGNLLATIGPTIAMIGLVLLLLVPVTAMVTLLIQAARTGDRWMLPTTVAGILMLAVGLVTALFR